MLTTLALALALVLLSVAAGRVVLRLAGADRAGGLEGAIGFAALTILAAMLIRLPGRAATAAALIGVLLVAGLVLTRRTPERGPGTGWAGAAVVAIVLAVAALPFALEGRTGVLGEGVYTNDHAAQLFWTEWLRTGFGPEPTAVAWGYPVGPQSLVAALAEVSGTTLVEAFNGLLLAIPALTGLAALSLLGGLRVPARVVAGALAGIPFLGASFLAQSAFKETAMGLLVLGFAAVLALAADGDPGRPRALGRRAAALAGTLLVLAAFFVFSVPGLVWFGLIAACWLVLAVAAGDAGIDWRALTETVRRRRGWLIATAVAIAAVAALSAGQIAGFVERIGEVTTSAGRLNSPVFPGEALGVWPQGDFRIVRGDVDGSLIATALAAVAVIAGAVALLRRRTYAPLAGLGAAVIVYAGARVFTSIHVEAKALAVMAPLAVVVALGGLLAARARPWQVALGVTFALAASASTFLALREAPVGFSDRGAELEQLAAQAQGEDVVFLGVDRFAAYWLRGTHVRSPGGYVPPDVGARDGKVWQQGRAMDLDTLAPSRLDDFAYAITTSAAFQSSPPENMREVGRTDSYVLWERTGRTPRSQVLNEGGDAGAVLEPGETGVGACLGSGGGAPGTAAVLPEPVIGGARGWSRGSPFEAPGRARRTLSLDPGTWRLSLQYHSQVELTLRAGETETTLPASLVGMYLTQMGRSAFWPAGKIVVSGGDRGVAEVEIVIEATEPGGLAGVVGAPRRVWLGEIAATRGRPGANAEQVPLPQACGEYVDRYVPR